MEDLIEHFSLEGVTKGAASFDPQKLFAFQEKHMATKTVAEKSGPCGKFLEDYFVTLATNMIEEDVEIAGIALTDLEKLIRYAGDRIKVAGDILDFTDFFIDDAILPYDEKALAKRIKEPPEAIPLLREFRNELARQDDFGHAALEQLMQQFLHSRNRKIADIIHALRVAVTGKAVGLGMFETLEILGKERVLRRIDRTLTEPVT